MVPRRLVICSVNRIQDQIAPFSKSGNPDMMIRTGNEIEGLSTAFHDRSKDIHENHQH